MKRSVLFLLFIISALCSFAQVTDNKDIVHFFIKNGEMDRDGETSVFASELLKKTVISNDSKCGIYRIGTFTDHSFVYLLLLNNGKKQFVNCHTDLSETLRAIFSFFAISDCKFTDAEKLLYIEKIIDIYSNNLKAIPW